MPCLNQTLDVQAGENFTIVPAHLDSGARAFFANTSRIVAGRNGSSATETAVSTTAITIKANTPGNTVFTVRMDDGGSCQVTIRVVEQSATGFQCPVPPRVIEHVENSGELCVSWAELGLNSNSTLLRPRLTPAVSFSYSSNEAPCAIRIQSGSIDRFDLGDTIEIQYQVLQSGQLTSCQASIRIVAHNIASPVIDQCVNGQVNLRANQPFQLSVSNATEPVTTLWSSPDPELSFNPENRTTTMVTASKSGNYTIDVECCFDDLT